MKFAITLYSTINGGNSSYQSRYSLPFFYFVLGTMAMLAHQRKWLNGQGSVLGQSAIVLTRSWVHFLSAMINSFPFLQLVQHICIEHMLSLHEKLVMLGRMVFLQRMGHQST